MRDLQAASLSWQICFHFFLPLALLPRRRNGHLKRTNEFALGAIIASGAAPRCVLFLLSHCGDRSIANERMSGCKITRQLCYAVTELFRSCAVSIYREAEDAVYNSQSQISWKNFVDIEITWQICRIWRHNNHKLTSLRNTIFIYDIQ